MVLNSVATKPFVAGNSHAFRLTKADLTWLESNGNDKFEKTLSADHRTVSFTKIEPNADLHEFMQQVDGRYADVIKELEDL